MLILKILTFNDAKVQTFFDIYQYLGTYLFNLYSVEIILYRISTLLI